MLHFSTFICKSGHYYNFYLSIWVNNEKPLSTGAVNNECCPYSWIVLFWGCCVSGGRVVAHQSEGWWFDSRQDTEPQLALGASSNRVCMVIAPDEQVAPCMVASVTGVWMCLWMLTYVVRRGRCYLITIQLPVKLKWFVKYWKKRLWHFPILAMIRSPKPQNMQVVMI